MISVFTDRSVPGVPLPDLVLVEPDQPLRVLEVLLDRPARSRDTHERTERRVGRAEGAIVRQLGRIAEAPTRQQPPGPPGRALGNSRLV